MAEIATHEPVRATGPSLPAGVAAYVDHLPADPMVKSVGYATQAGAVWIVTEVEAGGSIDALYPIFDAERCARLITDEALVFRVVDRSINESRQDGPLQLITVRG